jgi:hypothetical protein
VVLQAIQDRERPKAESFREAAVLAHEHLEQLRLDRHRRLCGWSPGGVAAYTVVLVTSAEEVDQARVKMTGSGFHTAGLLGISAGSRKETTMGRSTQHDARPDEGPAASPGRFDLLLIVMVSVYLLASRIQH